MPITLKSTVSQLGGYHQSRLNWFPLFEASPTEMKALNKVVLLGAFLITVWSLSICISISIAYHQEAEKNQYSAGQQNGFIVTDRGDGAGQYKSTNKGDNEADKDFLIAKVAPVLVSIIVAVILVFQVAINRGQLSTQRDELRAYVSPIITEILPIVAGQMLTFHFVPVNHGPTPARKFAFRGYTDCFENRDGALPSFDGRNWNEERMDVFPSRAAKASEEAFFVTSATQKSFTNEQLASVEAGTHRLVTALQVRYEDIFGREQFTEAIYTIEYHRNLVGATRVHVIPGTSRMT